MRNIAAILEPVRWLCQLLTIDELIIAASIILQVLNDERDDIRPRNDFQEKHPHYRKFDVDPERPLDTPPKPPAPKQNYKQLLAEYQQKTGRQLKPVKRRDGAHLPPKGVCCEGCGAPGDFLYVNDGKKASQLRCKVCSTLFPANRCRRESEAKYWCPCCGWALYKWKTTSAFTSYKCPNDNCPRRQQALKGLNARERELQKTGMSSQFKLCYQYREYHLQPGQLRTARPNAVGINLDRVRKHMNTVGLALAYSVSFGLSSRMTAQLLKCVHGIKISHQTVLNYQQAAAVFAARFIDKHSGPLIDGKIAGDETYIRVAGKWNYTWLVIGAGTLSIRAYNISEHRDTIPAAATLNMAIQAIDPQRTTPIKFVGDGNPSYDAAVHIINDASDSDVKPLERKTVVGLENLDDESAQYRPFKQLIERLNRTYKFHTRARSGFKNQQGAVALTTLFVAYYNFLRPHTSLKGNVPIHVQELHRIPTLQGQWLKLLQMGA